MITASKDKKVKVWDWIKQTNIASLMFHEDTVESIALTPDEKLLFTGSIDQKIGIWSMATFSLITFLKTTFPIRTVSLTDDNDYLIAIEKSEGDSKIFTWALEKNEDAFRININLTNVNF